MNKTIAKIFVLSTLLTAGFVIGTAFAEDVAPAAQPLETAQATTPESAAKSEPVKVDDAAVPAAPTADSSASAPASPATTPAASPSAAAPAAPVEAPKEAAPAAPAVEGHK